MNEMSRVSAQPAYGEAVQAFLQREPRLFIDGEWVESSHGKRIAVHDPSTGRLDENHPDIVHDLEHQSEPITSPSFPATLSSDSRRTFSPSGVMEAIYDRARLS